MDSGGRSALNAEYDVIHVKWGRPPCFEIIKPYLNIFTKGIKFLFATLQQVQSFLHCFFFRPEPTTGNSVPHKRLEFRGYPCQLMRTRRGRDFCRCRAGCRLADCRLRRSDVTIGELTRESSILQCTHDDSAANRTSIEPWCRTPSEVDLGSHQRLSRTVAEV